MIRSILDGALTGRYIFKAGRVVLSCLCLNIQEICIKPYPHFASGPLTRIVLGRERLRFVLGKSDRLLTFTLENSSVDLARFAMTRQS